MSDVEDAEVADRSRLQGREVLRIITQFAHKKGRTFVPVLTTEPAEKTGIRAELYAHGQMCLKRAAEVTGLDQNSPDFYKSLATLSAVALYSGHLRDTGRPPDWTEDDLVELWGRAEELRSSNPALSKSKMSKMLISTPPYSMLKGSRDSGFRYAAESLRSRLSDAYALAARLGLVFNKNSLAASVSKS